MLFIQCLENEELRAMMRQEFTEALGDLLNCRAPIKLKEQEWITTARFKALLTEKGYKATSSITLKKIVTNHNIKTEKRGRDLWYYLNDVQSIPSKI